MALELLLRQFAEHVATWAPAFVLVLFRIAGIFVMAPMLGSSRIPKRARVMMVLVIAVGMAGAVGQPVVLPGDLATLTVAIGGELIFGIAMGTVVSLVFVAAQWAGEIIGQQMGLSIVSAFDPQFGGAGSLVGDLYYMLALVIFMSPLVNGPAALLTGVHASFAALPLMSVGMNAGVLDLMTGMLAAAAVLAIQLAAPMLLTMLIVDVALGCIGKTMPQLNVMSAGLSIRVLVGLLVVIVGIKVTGDVIGRALNGYVERTATFYATPALSS
jgi:flagellar biosynthesis protein FliR